jgi:hypothetical protein
LSLRLDIIVSITTKSEAVSLTLTPPTIAIIPKANTPKKPMQGLKVVPVEYLYQALQYMSENT